MSDRVISFFEFKADRLGNLRFGVVQVNSQTLSPVALFSGTACRRDNDVCLLEEFDAGIVHEFLDGKIWIGHDIGTEYPRLMTAFERIGIDPPKAKYLFDTRALLSSMNKFAKLAAHFGLGKVGLHGYDDLLHNINAIKLSEDVVSLYEPEKMKDLVGRSFHPMICYLMDLTKADESIVEWIDNMMKAEADIAAQLLKDRVTNSIHDKNFTGKAEESNKRSTEANKKAKKKAKFVTPQKTETKKPHVHIATPHPSKQAGKNSGSNGEASKQQQTPKSAGAFGCKSCNRTFTSEMGLQSHTKAKHSAAA